MSRPARPRDDDEGYDPRPIQRQHLAPASSSSAAPRPPRIGFTGANDTDLHVMSFLDATGRVTDRNHNNPENASVSRHTEQLWDQVRTKAVIEQYHISLTRVFEAVQAKASSLEECIKQCIDMKIEMPPANPEDYSIYTDPSRVHARRVAWERFLLDQHPEWSAADLVRKEIQFHHAVSGRLTARKNEGYRTDDDNTWWVSFRGAPAGCQSTPLEAMIQLVLHRGLHSADHMLEVIMLTAALVYGKAAFVALAWVRLWYDVARPPCLGVYWDSFSKGKWVWKDARDHLASTITRPWHQLPKIRELLHDDNVYDTLVAEQHMHPDMARVVGSYLTPSVASKEW